jgi:hypothetical protein
MSFAESISHQATYEPKGITPSGLSIRSHKLISNAGSATIQPNQVFEFSIPTGNDALLDTNSMSLEFGVAIKELTNADKTIRFDGSAFSVLQSYTLLHNSVPLETCSELPLLANILFDLGMSFSDRATIQGSRWGMLNPLDFAYSLTFSNGGGANMPEGTSTTLTTSENANASQGNRAPDMVQTRWGASLWTNKNASASPAQPQYDANTALGHFSLPVLSGFIGSLAHRATPLYAMNGDLRVRFQTNLLERGLQATHTNNATNITSGYEWKLLDVRLVYKTIHLGGLANQMRLAYPMPTIASQYYGHASATIGAGDAQVQKTLAFRYSSLNDVLFCQTPTTYSGQTYNPEYTRRIRNNLTGFAIVIDGKYYPSMKMDTTKQGEILGYLADSQHAKNKAFWANSLVCRTQTTLLTDHSITGPAAGTDGGNPFMGLVGDSATATGGNDSPYGYLMNCTMPENNLIGITTQSFQHADNALLSGVDTLDKQVTGELTFNGGATEAATAHWFACFDVIYSVDSVGQTSVRY